MKLQDWLTLLAIVLGPVSAVVITLAIEARRRTKENRMRIVRMLLSTRHMPAHPDYCAAINLVPLEFNREKKVMDAWRRYHDVVRERPSKEQEADHGKRLNVAQAALIFQTMVATGLELSEGDIQTQAYVSQGLVDRDALYLKSLVAMPEIAEAMKTQVELNRALVAGMAARKGSNA